MVSHGAGSSGWIDLAALWVTAGKMQASLEPIEKHMSFAMQGFDCDNGYEVNQFLNEIVEVYLLSKKAECGVNAFEHIQKTTNRM